MRNAFRARSVLICRVKVLGFFLLILVLSLCALVIHARSDRTEVTVVEVLSGSFFAPASPDSGWIQRNVTFDDQTEPPVEDEPPIEPEIHSVEPGVDAPPEPSISGIPEEIQSGREDDSASDVGEGSDSASAVPDIVYTDTAPPEIILTGETEYHLPVAEEFVEPGYSAFDAEDGDLTEQVTVSGTVETYRAGSYTLTYSVRDSSGNTATAERTVVRDPMSQPEVVDPGGKTIYLTFDDGPGPYTRELLDLLDRYGVKVTFFVTAQKPAYLDLIGEEYARGHTVAIHSYSHNYAIYTSEETYFEDLYAMQDVIREQTGTECTIVRFPGGSSNTVSEKYSTGIMTTLAEALTSMGYQYFDWNVSSGDAGGTTDTDQVIANIENGVQRNGDHPSFVLQHDIKDFSVAAVEEVIVWGLENGYQFLPLQSSSPICHHNINN